MRLVGTLLQWPSVPMLSVMWSPGSEVVGFTTDTRYDIGGNDDATLWKVQAVGEFGGLSKYGEAMLSLGVEPVAGDGVDKRGHTTYYTPDGRQIQRPGAGLTIVRTVYSDGCVHCTKVMK